MENTLGHAGLTAHEADRVIAGVAQRAQALRRLVIDVNSRKAGYIRRRLQIKYDYKSNINK